VYDHRKTMSDLSAAMALGRDCQDDVVKVLLTTSCTICPEGEKGLGATRGAWGGPQRPEAGVAPLWLRVFINYRHEDTWGEALLHCP
jgi:hypothetical protein